MIDPGLVLLAGGAGGAGWAWYRRRRRRSKFPTNLVITDPLPTSEGVFRIGRYLPNEGEECSWRPWDGGEQHLGVFGTTNSGKTVLARNLIVTAAERMGWEVKVADGAKGGIDFTFVKDSGLGLVVTKGAIPVLLDETAAEIERRAQLLDGIRVPRPDPQGVMRAVAPSNLRELSAAERARHGLRPMLLVIDELAMLLAAEDRKKRPISGPLLRIAAAGRFVGIHLVAIMQRGDADLLDGFIGNLLRARVLVGSTDQTAEQMAHGSAVKVWEAMAEAAGYPPDGMERALRPPGRALVSGLAVRPPGLVQLYRFDPISRAPSWDEYASSPAPGSSAHGSADAPATDSPDASSASASPQPHLRLVGAPAAPSSDDVPFGEGDGASSGASSRLRAVGSAGAPRPRRRRRLAVAARRLRLRLVAWRWLLAPLVSDPPRDPGLRGEVAQRDRGVCSVCGERARTWHAEHTRPLSRGGADALENMTTMCVPCHAVKSAAEARVRAISRRWSRRSGMRLPRPPAWQLALGACLLAGAVDGRWRMHALLVLLALALGPALIRTYVIPKPWRRSRGGGLDGVPALEAKLESERGGMVGSVSRGYYTGRLRVFTLRVGVMMMSGAYLAGYFLPRALL